VRFDYRIDTPGQGKMNFNEYCERLRVGGFRVLVGSKNTLWLSHERFSMLRQPAFALHVPSREEIKSVFRQSHAAVLSFVVRPSNAWVANSCHYFCADPEYSLEKLGRGARYDTRRGLSEFEIKFMDQSEMLRLGERAYRDTLARTGLSAEHRQPFEIAFGRPRPDRLYLVAMKGNQLASFLVVTEVDDWVSIGGYSANEFLPLRPNNALIYYVVHYYLVERKFRVVDYGLSSVQADSKAEGLHRFKLKMGFESVPVHRAFVINPLLRPLANRVSWRLINGILKLSPQNPVLKKAEGALRMALQSYG
jgi:hypothetical protein